MQKRWFRAVLAALALGLAGLGAWMAYRPAGPFVVGLLIWADLYVASRRGTP